MRLESHLRDQRSKGRKLLVPYMTGGLRDDWLDLVRAMADAGADAIEIGLPFSDPMMDGPTIQEASQIALDRGTTPVTVLHALRGADIGVPLVVMTYYNIAFAAGHERFAGQLVDAGVDGVILPDLPLEESGPWREVADAAGVENVLLAAPTSPDSRLGPICEASRGFVYAVGTVGVTGERASLASTATEIATRLKAVTDKPVIVGIGVSNAEQAAEVCSVADGAVVASAILRRLLDGHDADDMYRFVSSLRSALDR